MSYHTWSIDGFGVCLDGLRGKRNYTKESIMAFVKLAPNFKNSFCGWANDLEELSLSDEAFVKAVEEEYESEWNCSRGIAGLIQDVFAEFSQSFVVCDDYEDSDYLLYTPSYPWQANDNEREWTEEKINEIITNALKVLDSTFGAKACYLSAENGG